MMYRRFFIALALFAGIIGICSFVGFEEDPLTKISRQLQKWTKEQPVEKVYLQLDKPYYAAGEDIWFKAYVVSGGDRRLRNISDIVNVELIDEIDSVKQSLKLPLDSGAANGDFALPDTLHQGNYRVRAYTNYMRNAGSEYFFDKAVPVINTIWPCKKITNKTSAVNKAAGKTDVQFFPEGGSLVNNIPTKVAFKAVAPNGLGVDIKGVVTDNEGRQVAQLSSAHLGMGVFELTPVSGITYQAKIIDKNGAQFTAKLPFVVDKGYVLNIDQNGPQSLLVKITASGTMSVNASNELTLVAQSGGKIYYSHKAKPGTIPFTSVIPKNKFPSGLVQFTLFLSSGEPLNERLVFVQNPDQLNLTITGNQRVYAPRQDVKLTLTAQDGDHKPVKGDFSVAVIDESKTPVYEANENNIIANLLLTSDIRGYVEQPAWYFNNPNDKTRAALDVLMLTQGYHRFEWKRILDDDFPAKQYQPENSLQLSGTVLTVGGKPVVNGKVKLFDLDSIEFTRDTVTDEQGRFVFKNLTFDDSVRFIVQARTDKNKKNVDIKMDQPIRAGTSGNINGPDFNINVSNSLSVYAQNSSRLYAEQRKYGLGNHVFTLQEVVVREKKEKLRYSANLNGPGSADQIVDGRLLRDLGCANIPDCLQGRLLGVTFRSGVAYSTRDYKPMQLIVDGVYVDKYFLNNLNYTDVQAIEVLRNASFTSIYGGQGGSGVLLVTTRRGGDDDSYPEPIYGRGITTNFPKGYYKTREFYSPRYNWPETNKHVADLRTTVFWGPNLRTGADGRVSFEYFNAGSKGTYRVVVEGMGADGSIGRQVYRYSVE